MKNNINGYNINEDLKSFFELPLGDDLILSIYDSEEGYEIEIIEDIDNKNEYIDTMIYECYNWEKLKTLIEYAINNTYSRYLKNLIIEKVKEI